MISLRTHTILKRILIFLVFPVVGAYSYIAYVVYIKGSPQEHTVEALPLEKPSHKDEPTEDTGPVGEPFTPTNPGTTASKKIKNPTFEVPETKEEIIEWEEDFSTQPSNYGDF